MQINSFDVDGRLVDSVKYKKIKKGTSLATFKLANNCGKQVNYFIIAAFGARADYAHKYLKKGERVFINGRMNHHQQQDDKGNWHDYYTVIANTFDPITYGKQSKSTRDIYAKITDLQKRVDDVSHAK